MNGEAGSITSAVSEESIKFPFCVESSAPLRTEEDQTRNRRQEVRWSAAQAKEASFWQRQGVFEPEMGRVTSRYVPIIRELSSRLEQDSRILDVGCGPTCVSQFFPVGTKTYLDPLMDSYLASSPTKRMPEGEHLCGMAERIPKKDKSFDLVICVNALDHMCDPAKALQEMRRVLKDDGMFVLGIFLHPRPTALLRRFVEKCLPVFREDAHPYSYTLGSIRSLLSEFFVIQEQVRVFRKDSSWFPSIHREDWMFISEIG